MHHSIVFYMPLFSKKTLGLDEYEPNVMYSHFRVIPCKGSRYPATLPRPAVHILEFEIPLCDLSTDKGKMEVQYSYITLEVISVAVTFYYGSAKA